MKIFITFNHYFLRVLWKIKIIVFWLLTVLVADAAAIAYFEKMPFADALYFTFVTGLTIGYGDIAPVTPIGRLVAILTGLQGLLITGLIVAVAVFAVKETMEHPPDNH
jgi:voltage-gated potassium channel